MIGILGLVEGISIIAIVFIFSVNNLAEFFQPRILIYMIAGLIALALMTFQTNEIVNAFRHFIISLLNEDLYARKDKEEILRIAKIRYRDDPFALEKALESINSPFLKTGVQL